jgi:hypothetical protein
MDNLPREVEMNRIAGAVAATVVLVATVAATQQTRPNLSGTWALDIAASNFAKEAPPAKKVVTIEHLEPKLTMSVVEDGPSGAVKGEAQYLTDKTPVMNSVLGNPMTTIAAWEGAELVMTTTGTFGDNEIMLVDRYALSGDGRTLTVRRHFEGKQRGGVQDQVLVHRKQ